MSSGQDSGVRWWSTQFLPPFTTTSKLQLNYRKAIIGSLLKSSWTKVLQLGTQEENTSRLVREAETCNRPVPHPLGVVENREEYLGLEVTLEEQGVPAPH